LYFGYEEDQIRYVGMTGRDPEIRFKEHWRSGTKRSDLKYAVYKKNLTKLEARIWEQIYINEYGMLKFDGKLLNQRNEIRPQYWDLYGIKKTNRNINDI